MPCNLVTEQLFRNGSSVEATDLTWTNLNLGCTRIVQPQLSIVCQQQLQPVVAHRTAFARQPEPADYYLLI